MYYMCIHIYIYIYIYAIICVYIYIYIYISLHDVAQGLGAVALGASGSVSVKALFDY